MRHLAALPCFPLVYRNLAASLRRACQVETDPATVALYIRSVRDCFQPSMKIFFFEIIFFCSSLIFD